MREIKFRAWDDNQEIIIGWEQLKLDKEEGEKRFSVIIFEDSVGNYYDDFPLMQYTGLKDSNGREIYEGDIVKLPVEMNTGIHGKHAYYEILYRNGLWITSYLSSEKGFILPRGYLVGELIDFAEDMRKSLVFNDFEAKLKDVEIVGNIYGNIELLEGSSA